MRRITLEGPELNTFAWSGPAAHIKVIFPDPETGLVPAFSLANRPTSMRTYTPRRFDPDTRQLRVRNGPMPSDAAWPQEWVDVFARWIAAGKPQ